MFLLCQTQWRTGPSGFVGLDYSVVFELFTLYDVGDKKKLLDELQIMEFRALQLIDKQNKQEQKMSERKSNRGR